MFEINVKEIDQKKENTLIKKNINLDVGLDCFLLISSSNAGFAENILNHTLEYLIERISKDDTYNDFSISLENINSLIKTWKLEGDNKDDSLDMIIGILNDNVYTFSNIGNSSAYLINKNNEVIELTESSEYKKEFSYISNGKLLDSEIVVSSTVELLNYLSKSDLIDGLVLSDDIEIFNRNIQNILESEILDVNCLVSSLKIKDEIIEDKRNEKKEIVKEYFAKAIDNKFSKKIIGFFMFVSDKLKNQSKMIKNIILVAGIFIGIVLLYTLLSALVDKTTQTENKENAKGIVIEIRDKLRSASENINNIEIFEKNINEAEQMIKKIESQKLYLNDLAKITDDLNLLKQQFNKIEIFYENESNIVHSLETTSGIKIVKDNLVPYVIDNKSIIGPILSTAKPQIYTFSNLGENETFIDGIFINSNLFILTNNSQIIKFTKNGHFEYVSVIGQNKWEDIKQLGSYLTNLYTLGENNQINKHAPSGNDFKAAEGYLKEEDINQVGEILSIAIDGGFYILKKDLTIVKFFSYPYRLEGILLNKLPKNYTLEEGKKVEIKASANLNYVYMLLNNKIWIFKPNSTRYTDTQNLTYIGQIEGATKQIKDFYVNYDGEILILNESGIYKLNFEVSDDKIVIR